MTIKVKKDGTYVGASNHTDVIRALIQQTTKLKAEQIAALTDNSTGDPTPTAGEVQVVAAFAGAAASGSNLAGKATTETALGKVKNAITELATKANAFATALGVTGLTDSSGGTAADGTIAACDVSVTGATTGALVENSNTIRLAINDAFAEITKVVNRCAVAVGHDELEIDYDDFASTNGTVGAIGTDTGTAADPGVTKAEMDAALVKWVDNIAYIAAKLNDLRTTEAVFVTLA